MASEDGIQLLSVNEMKEDEQQVPPPYVQRSHSPMQSQRPVHNVTTPRSHVTGPMQYPQMGASQQMSNTSTVVVAGQPTSHLPPVTVVESARKPGQGILIFSLVMVAVCPLVCNIPSLFILIPGVIFALVGFNFSHSHDPTKRQTGRGFSGVSLCCSVTALVSYVTYWVCGILFIAIYYGILTTRPSYYPYCSYDCQQECFYGSCSSSCYCRYS